MSRWTRTTSLYCMHVIHRRLRSLMEESLLDGRRGWLAATLQPHRQRPLVRSTWTRYWAIYRRVRSPSSALQEDPSQDIPSVLRTSNFMVGGMGTSGRGIGRRQHVRLGDMANYCPDDSHTEETQAERDARIDAEEESRLSRMQWVRKVAYLAEVERMRRLETIGAGGNQESVEAVLGQDAALQPSGGGHVSPHPPTSLPHTTTDRPAATHHATVSPSPTIMGHVDVAPVSESPPGPCGSPVSHAPLTSKAGGSGTMDSKSQVVRDVVLGDIAPGGAEL
ncbi:hypothetical protein CBR_g3218 [Chara braunii]|uniref:Uncharacterized protein n=1 Tax=Chara braunii TaxID=69332 RepID=A0A388KF92_CHABU|nr:hypothetical protein CBR_g3218 [Chara braunii]|eukprot:GBG68677.1 hypothetical protein CBR_g3218 [Chara braunii]